MRILQVIHYFSPLHGGGSINVAYNLSKHLAERGHEVTIFTSDFELDKGYIHSLEGVRVVPFHCIANIGLMLISSKMKKQLKEEINNFDVIHIHNFRSYQNIIVHNYAKKYKIPYVLHAHGSVPRIIEKKGLKYLFDIFWGYKVLRDASKVIAVSNVEVDQYVKMGAPKEKIVIIPNGIEISSFNDLPEKGTFRKQYGISEKYIVLFLGRLHERKGIEFLIESFAELKKEMNDVVLVVAGSDGGYRAKAEILINKLKLTEQVKFTGFIDEIDKFAAYVDADVLVYPAIFEIFGLVPFEAIMCGTPIIVTDDCGCGELVKEARCGYLVKYRDVNDLNEKMKLILENPDRGKEMVAWGQKYIKENLTWDNVVGKVVGLYEDCIYNF